jgi:hypothetical protein
MQTNIYYGTDIHTYTPLIKELLVSQYSDVVWNKPMDENEYTALMDELTEQFNKHPAITNIQRFTKNGTLVDPQLGETNFIRILHQLWKRVKQLGQVDHFKETLDQIGDTCIQGISHRILIDWVALSE